MKTNAALLVLVLALVACEPKYVDDCQMVKIVKVMNSHEVGNPDWYTVVEFPDRTRALRFNAYGEVGDSLCARKSNNGANWR